MFVKSKVQIHQKFLYNFRFIIPFCLINDCHKNFVFIVKCIVTHQAIMLFCKAANPPVALGTEITIKFGAVASTL